MSSVIELTQLGMSDVGQVGGKNASLGEMISNLSEMGVKVPGGFATTADAYRAFISQDALDTKIHEILDHLDVDDVESLAKAGAQIREWVIETPFQSGFEEDVRAAFTALSGGQDISVAVRSSATAEDLPDASFAGQQETILNVRGIDEVIKSIKVVFASLFNDRAIAYRVHKGFDHKEVALSAGIQRMVRSDLGSSGVMFTLDTESGFDKAIFITSAYGLGETVVQGAVNPDEFYVYKPNLEKSLPPILRRTCGSKALKMIFADADSTETVKTISVSEAEQQLFSISDDDVVSLSKQAVIIENHYGRPMDIEWAKDGESGEIFIVQARPETVKSRANAQVLETYQLNGKSNVLVEGRSIGQKIGQGVVKVLSDLDEMSKVREGDVLVTDMTDPDWEPVMKRASAIVTNRGGRTCHAAIIARELGIPAVVGSNNATKVLKDGQEVTISCAEGDVGFVYEGIVPFERKEINLDTMPSLPFKVMMNVGNPDRAFSFASLPNAGVGLARLEFIINRMIGIHPKALLNPDAVDPDTRAIIDARVAAYNSPKEYYIEKLVEGIATIAAAFAPQPIIVRMSDFKSNEYANLVGGHLYEPHEENPMLGFRGASRYVSDEFEEAFALECEALKRVRDVMGLTNVWVMVPFVRTPQEADKVIEGLEAHGLKRGQNDLKLIMMCELPVNALMAEDFLKNFDGFSIGSNDLTQLTLGLDRDSGLIAHHFDERNAAVKELMRLAIKACRDQGKYIGICGQGPSDHPDLAQWLAEEGIESISLNPDSVLQTWLYLADHLKKH